MTGAERLLRLLELASQKGPVGILCGASALVNIAADLDAYAAQSVEIARLRGEVETLTAVAGELYARDKARVSAPVGNLGPALDVLKELADTARRHQDLTGDEVTELEDDLRAHLSAARSLTPAPASVRFDIYAFATDVAQAVAELPERDSPEDWPLAMLVESEELRGIIVSCWEERQ